jgi:two-component system cell cycle response regulator DivK
MNRIARTTTPDYINEGTLTRPPRIADTVMGSYASAPRILLVEDNEMNRDMLSRRLERRGFEMIIACDGLEGIQAAQQHLPDLILMDLSLPKIDGWEATRILKSEASTSAIPLIVLTAHAADGECTRTLEMGADDFATKPIEFDRLLNKMRNLLSVGVQLLC